MKETKKFLDFIGLQHYDGKLKTYVGDLISEAQGEQEELMVQALVDLNSRIPDNSKPQEFLDRVTFKKNIWAREIKNEMDSRAGHTISKLKLNSNGFHLIGETFGGEISTINEIKTSNSAMRINAERRLNIFSRFMKIAVGKMFKLKVGGSDKLVISEENVTINSGVRINLNSRDFSARNIESKENHLDLSADALTISGGQKFDIHGSNATRMSGDRLEQEYGSSKIKTGGTYTVVNEGEPNIIRLANTSGDSGKSTKLVLNKHRVVLGIDKNNDPDNNWIDTGLLIGTGFGVKAVVDGEEVPLGGGGDDIATASALCDLNMRLEKDYQVTAKALNELRQEIAVLRQALKDSEKVAAASLCELNEK